MSGNDAPSLVDSLREKQKSLNDAIDSYVSLASERGANKLDIDSAQGEVSAVSSSIASLTENPFWAVTSLSLKPILNTAVRIAVDLNLFNIITSKPITIHDIVSTTSADRTLIIRVTRCLAAFDILNEVGPHTFSSTPFSTTLTHPIVEAWTKMNYDNCVPRTFKLPAYLASQEHRSPIHIDDFNISAFSGKSMWDQLSANHSQLATFQNSMKLADIRPPEAAANYDFESNLGTPPESGITLIDVGGGHGYALETILKSHPSLPGRFILQDLPDTINQVASDPSRAPLKFEPVIHDFFTPQPASMRPRWFYLRYVLHDWSDESALKILGHLRDAIAESSSYSSILLAELMLPDKGPRQFDVLLDINMMQLGGMERSESQWRELLDQAGLKIKGITRAKMGDRCVLEVVLKDEKESKAKIQKG